MSRSSWRPLTIPAVAVFCLVILMSAAVAEVAENDDRQRLMDAARDVIARSTFCALVTIGADGSPHVRMMDAFAPDDDMVVWMGTSALTRKVQDIRGNSKVAVYYADPQGPSYVTIRGSARLVDDLEETRKRWKDEWSIFYGEDKANYLLIEIRPEAIEIVDYRADVVSKAASWAAPTLDFERQETPTGE